MRAAVAWLFRMMFCRETFWSLLICLILVSLMIMSADQSPLWIYQGF